MPSSHAPQNHARFSLPGSPRKRAERDEYLDGWWFSTPEPHNGRPLTGRVIDGVATGVREEDPYSLAGGALFETQPKMSSSDHWP